MPGAAAIVRTMHLPMPEARPDTPAQRAADRRRLQRALNASLAAVLVLAAVFSAQPAFDWTALAIAPHATAGLIGIATAPLLHGSLVYRDTTHMMPGFAVTLRPTLVRRMQSITSSW